MRILVRTLLLVLACLALAAPAGARRLLVVEGRPSASELRDQANEAAGRYNRAQAEAARLESQITQLEGEIAALEAEMAPLRAVVTRRAVAIYKGSRGLEALSALGQVADPVEGARRARMAAQVSAQDLRALEALGRSAAELRERRTALGVRYQEQQDVLAAMEGERGELEATLGRMAREGVRSRLVREPRVSRGTARSEAPAPAPGEIPVATGFICPIAGPVAFTDSWGDPRSGGRRHKGTDLMNPRGTDNVAVVSGEMESHHSGAGGLSVYLHGDDGNTYFYAHLQEVVGPNRRVAQGEVIGRTGNSGNARGASPHTHFEIHLGGASAINPYPTIAAHCS